MNAPRSGKFGREINRDGVEDSLVDQVTSCGTFPGVNMAANAVRIWCSHVLVMNIPNL